MAVGNVEIIGPREIRDMGNGKYISTPVKKGVAGACIIDEKAVEELRKKYSGNSDSFDKTPAYTEDEVNKKRLLSMMCPMLIPFILSDKDYVNSYNQYIEQEGSKFNKEHKIGKLILAGVVGLLGGVGLAKLLPKIVK
jgi:hypothetical protein